MMKSLLAVLAALASLPMLAETPKLNIRTMHGFPAEEQRKQQMERRSRQYDLKNYTITRDIMIERGAMNHSSPVPTLSLRYLDNDDVALSAYVHEQGHWVLMERHRNDNPRLFEDLGPRFPTWRFGRLKVTASNAAAISISLSACWNGRPWKKSSASSARAK